MKEKSYSSAAPTDFLRKSSTKITSLTYFIRDQEFTKDDSHTGSIVLSDFPFGNSGSPQQELVFCNLLEQHNKSAHAHLSALKTHGSAFLRWCRGSRVCMLPLISTLEVENLSLHLQFI